MRERSKRVHPLKKSSRRAFTLTEFMVSMGLTVVLIAAATIAISLGRPQRKLDSAKERLMAFSDYFDRRLQADLDEAIRVKGRSTANYSGITRFPALPVPESNDSQNDGIQMVQGLFSAFNSPVKFVGGKLILPPPDDPTMNSIHLVFKELLQANTSQMQKLLFVVSTPKDTHIFPPGANAGSISNNQLEYVPGGIDTFQDRDFSSVGNGIGLAQVVVYKLNGTDLVRQDFEGSQVVMKNVSSFRVSYRFADYADKDQTVVRIPPQDVLRHPAAPYTIASSNGQAASQCPNPANPKCIDGSNIVQVLVHYEIFDPNTRFPKNLLKEGDGFKLTSDDQLALRQSNVFFPRNFHPTNLIGQAFYAKDTTCQDLKPWRCLDRCADHFVSTNRAADNWIGYKKGSPYCTCGTDDTGNYQKDFDSVGIDHNWNTSVGRKALEACFTAFGCRDGNYQGKGWAFNSQHSGFRPGQDNPAAWISCYCLQPTLGMTCTGGSDPTCDPIARPTIRTDTQGYSYHTGPIIEGDGLYDALSGFTDAFIEDSKGIEDENILCNGGWTMGSCGAAFQNWADSVGRSNPIMDPVTNPTQKTFDQNCKHCNAGWADSNGDGYLHGYNGELINWAQVCNQGLDYSDPAATNVTCPNTAKVLTLNASGEVDASAPAKFEYLRRDVDRNKPYFHKRGLSQWEETHCRCQRKVDPQSFTPPGFGGSSSRDFRNFSDTANVVNVPGVGAIPINSHVVHVFGTLARPADIDTTCTSLPWYGGHPLNSCAPNPVGLPAPLPQPSTSPGFGMTSSAEFMEKLTAAPPLGMGRDPASIPVDAFRLINYCKSSCTDSRVAGVKKWITATGPSDVLPYWCGGTQTQESGYTPGSPLY